MSRYALYYAPQKSSPWQEFGATWLGRCSIEDRLLAQSQIEGVEPDLLTALTEAPRRYGFHATLKAPFRLAADTTLTDLSGALDRFCATQSVVEMSPPQVTRMGEFLALAWAQENDQVASIASECVTRFDDFRATLESSEITRRRGAGLSSREDQLMLRWGYPHVLDQFRLHMSLTGPLAQTTAAVARRVHEAATSAVALLSGTPFLFDAISIYEEPTSHAPFRLVHRSPFKNREGCLIYVVGASGAGKDSLISYARMHLPSEIPVRFARRTITRALEAGGEDHIAVTPAQFSALEAQQAFCLIWHANNLSYGIDKEVAAWVAAGEVVVVNGSRSHARQAAEYFPDMALVEICADAGVLLDRLHQRAREDTRGIESRMQRLADGWAAPPMKAHRIFNNGALADAGNALVALIVARSINAP